MSIRKILTSNMSYPASQYKGKTGELFYDNAVKELRISDGVTVGGTSLNVGGGTVISSLSDFPDPVSGVITLPSDTAYYLDSDIDLLGNRLVADGVVAIIGTSSETTFLTSTGLANNTPLLTSRYTIPMRDITIRDVHTAIYIDDNGGANAPVAVDWRAVNFADVTNIGEIGTVDNFIFETGAFINSQNINFTGTVGTVGVFNSIFRGNGSNAPIFNIASTAVISRRFRITYSSIIASSSTKGIEVDSGASIPVEGLILDTINFSGGGTYLSGVNTYSASALFVNCVGVLNSTAISQMYMRANAVATACPVQSTRYPVTGTTSTTESLNQKFTHVPARNALQYTSTIPRLFKVTATFSLTGGQNDIIGFYIGKKLSASAQNTNNDRLQESEVYVTTTGTKPDAGTVQTIVELNQGDEIYTIVQNTSGTGSVTVGYLNVIVERTN
jgi:hypothetical protein